MECYDIFKQKEVKNKPTTKNTLTRLSFRFDEKNQKLYRQEKAGRIQNHQINFIPNAKRPSLGGKGKVPTRNKKI